MDEIMLEKVEKYYNLQSKISGLKENLSALNNEIKLEIDKIGRRRINIGGKYMVEVKAKNRVSNDFIKLLKENNLGYLIKESCGMKEFEKGCKEMDIKVGSRGKYVIPIKSKWLYVTKI